MQGDADDDGSYFFFSAPASPVHYILRSPPSSTAASSPSLAGGPADRSTPADAAGDFEFAAHGARTHGGPAGTKGDGVAMMSSAEELFVAGRIRVGCLSPIRQEEDDGDEDEEEEERDGRSPRATRRARSVSPTRSPRGAAAEPSHPFASASSSSSSSSSSSKNIRRRISLRDLLSRTNTGGGDCAGADQQASSGAEVTSRLGFWPTSIWPSSSRSSKKSSPDSPLPCPATPQPGRRRSTSGRGAAVATTTAKRAAPGGSARRTTSLPYRQGLVLGCLGFGPRGYGLANSMHPLPSR